MTPSPMKEAAAAPVHTDLITWDSPELRKTSRSTASNLATPVRRSRRLTTCESLQDEESMGQIYSTASSLFSSWSKESSAVVHKENTAPVCTPDLASFTPSTYPLATPRRALCRTKRDSKALEKLSSAKSSKNYIRIPVYALQITILCRMSLGTNFELETLPT
ncbi:hypothetical protein E2C01_011465 [Portunus trituberculatus]|uniref:Uncharacterized protein n=1 Tax=Portunus trituberculatus TaxID=210409 RepID=A0A5B7DBD4_PORTR|nr:hypothetical protein [Portunus trituberculatus]